MKHVQMCFQLPPHSVQGSCRTTTRWNWAMMITKADRPTRLVGRSREWMQLTFPEVLCVFFKGDTSPKVVLQEFVGGFLKKMLFFELVLMVKDNKTVLIVLTWKVSSGFILWRYQNWKCLRFGWPTDPPISFPSRSVFEYRKSPSRF